jgi:sn-glycerol 3-phosphate transport system substrate-binding protein
MTPMRRLRLVSSVLLAGSLLAACGGGGDGDSPSGGGDEAKAAACPLDALKAATSPVEITFWHTMTANNEVTLKALTDEYNASQDKVRVKLAFQGTYEETFDKYVTALRGGTLPNVAMLEATTIQSMIDTHSAMPVQACVDAADYDLSDHLPVVIDQFTIDDTLWPMPFNVSTPVLYYDTNDFEKAGLDPNDPPSTFDELEAAARAIKESGAAKSGMALTLRPGNIEQWFNLADEPIVDHDNGRDGRAEHSLLDSEVGVESLAFMQRMIEEGLAVNVGQNANESDNVLALGAGDVGMTIGTSAALGTIWAVKDAGQYADVGVGVAPMPGPERADGGGIFTDGGALWITDKGASDGEKAASWDYVRFLNEPSSQATWHIGSGYIPLRKAAVDDPEIKALWERRPSYRVSYDQLAGAGGRSGAVIGAYKGFREALVAAMEKVLVNGEDPRAALQAADEQASEAMQSYNERVGG